MPRSAISIDSSSAAGPAHRRRHAGEHEHRAIGLRGDPLRRARVSVGADDEHMTVGIPGARVPAGERDRAPVGREQRRRVRPRSIGQAPRSTAGGGDHPGVGSQLAVIAPPGAIGGERDRVAIGRERRVGVVVITAGQLPRLPVGHVDHEQVAAPLLPADPVQAGAQPAYPSWRVALLRAGLLAIGHAHSGRRPRSASTRAPTPTGGPARADRRVPSARHRRAARAGRARVRACRRSPICMRASGHRATTAPSGPRGPRRTGARQPIRRRRPPRSTIAPGRPRCRSRRARTPRAGRPGTDRGRTESAAEARPLVGSVACSSCWPARVSRSVV